MKGVKRVKEKDEPLLPRRVCISLMAVKEQSCYVQLLVYKCGFVLLCMDLVVSGTRHHFTGSSKTLWNVTKAPVIRC